MTLHITNGDAFTEVLRNAGIAGDILPWRDILHEGPVPSDASPQQFNAIRARFIADRGWGSYEDVRASFDERDRALAGAHIYEEIVLWFDPDLYDQLQLVQVLSRLSQMSLPSTTMSLVATDRPGVDNADEIRALYAQRTPVTDEQFALGRRTWEEITSARPDGISAIVNSDTIAVLPWLGAALNRYLEEFPLESDGLSRTERMILHHAEEPSSLLDLFSAVQNSEEHAFLGDTTFASYIERFVTSAAPLLEPAGAPVFIPSAQSNGYNEYWNQRVQLTETGRHVVEHEASNIRLNGIDRHVGGVHLQQNDLWYWSRENGLVRTHQ